LEPERAARSIRLASGRAQRHRRSQWAVGAVKIIADIMSTVEPR
jgi:hypothetical protein